MRTLWLAQMRARSELYWPRGASVLASTASSAGSRVKAGSTPRAPARRKYAASGRHQALLMLWTLFVSARSMRRSGGAAHRRCRRAGTSPSISPSCAVCRRTSSMQRAAQFADVTFETSACSISIADVCSSRETSFRERPLPLDVSMCTARQGRRAGSRATVGKRQSPECVLNRYWSACGGPAVAGRAHSGCRRVRTQPAQRRRSNQPRRSRERDNVRLESSTIEDAAVRRSW
jgi:hypothetical protein